MKKIHDPFMDGKDSKDIQNSGELFAAERPRS